MRPGLEILSDSPGGGTPVERCHTYLTRLKLWLNKGDAVRWTSPWGNIDRARLEDGGQTLISDLRIDRHNLFSGLFYGIDDMRIGGVRRLRISPHLAYGERGVPGIIPAKAVLIVEVAFLEESNPQR